MRPTYVVSCVRVVIDTAEECRRRVLANVLGEQVTATRVLVHEVRDVVDEARNDDQRPLLGLLEDYSVASALDSS